MMVSVSWQLGVFQMNEKLLGELLSATYNARYRVRAEAKLKEVMIRHCLLAIV